MKAIILLLADKRIPVYLPVTDEFETTIIYYNCLLSGRKSVGRNIAKRHATNFSGF